LLHIKLCKELNGKETVVVFGFLGENSIRFHRGESGKMSVYKFAIVQRELEWQQFV
jgi:hypothetical protein